MEPTLRDEAGTVAEKFPQTRSEACLILLHAQNHLQQQMFAPNTTIKHRLNLETALKVLDKAITFARYY